MIGISISLYDKFQELSILVDIIRRNWDADYYISVCSNHPNAQQRISDLDLAIDSFESGSNINYDPTMSGVREEVNKVCRVYDTIQTACTNALQATDVSHVMHVHADAWPLSETQLHELINEMESQNKSVAFKGRGLGDRGSFPLGHIMDQFFILNTEFSLKRDFFEFSPLELLPDRGIHTIMLLILLGKVGWSNVYYYSDQQDQFLWNGESTMYPRPMMFNPRWEHLHVATEDFHGDLGKSIQASYLKQHDITDGDHVEALLDAYHRSQDDLEAALDRDEAELNEALDWLGLSLAHFGYNFREATDVAEMNAFDQIRFAIDHHLTRGKRLFERILTRNPFSDSTPSLPHDDPVKAAWPDRNLHDVYTSELQPDDFPDEYVDPWFVTDND
jgi:hypothetical protein